MHKKILVTGAAGYIGSVLVYQLLQKGYRVKGMDSLLFGGNALLAAMLHPNFEFFHGDIRKEKDNREAIRDIWGVVHLAAIVGDPACAAQPELAKATNFDAAKMLFDLCSDSKQVKRFVFASTCSNYGKMKGQDFVDETSPLNPVSLYAELKVKFENYMIKNVTRLDFIPTALRFATVYGISPRMRFDLTINEFTREIALGEKLEIFGEQFWRPYCHVEDLGLACINVLKAKKDLVNHNVFNVGNTKDNYTKKMLAEILKSIEPNAQIKFVQKTEDPRDYKVNFQKIFQSLDFVTKKNIKSEIQKLFLLIRSNFINNPYSDLYKNI